MPKVGKSYKPPIKKPDDIVCTACGSTNKNNFYISKSSLFQKKEILPICKDCIDVEYDNYLHRFNFNIDKAIYYLCMKLDVPFYQNVVNGVKSQMEDKVGSNKPNRLYFQKINSFRDKNHYGNDFLDGERNIEKRDGLSLTDEDVELHNKWGRLPEEDILFLEDQWKDWCTRYDVSTKAMELLVTEICYQQLTIKRKREQNGASVSKELKDLQDLMNSSALKPIQETAAMSADLNTLGTWIKKFENEKPFPEPDPDFIDVDKIKRYVRVYFLGHFCKMLGLTNEYSQEYEEEMMKYKVEIDNNLNSFDEEKYGDD